MNVKYAPLATVMVAVAAALIIIMEAVAWTGSNAALSKLVGLMGGG